jgi:hypothetical protein
VTLRCATNVCPTVWQLRECQGICFQRRANTRHRFARFDGRPAEFALVSEAERAFVAKLVQIQEATRSLTETDLALAEATMGDELERLPPLAVNEYSETERLSRFNGGSRWSLKESTKVEKFFSQTFGHHLPISAYGQTATHDRMGFDHRNAIDVALHPDSAEGRALMRHLRESGIPFVAFKNAVPGAATGPHIHIGKPPVRIGHGSGLSRPLRFCSASIPNFFHEATFLCSDHG